MTAGTIWLLVCSALVLFMTPGLAFFYGGLVKAKSVISMMMLSFGALGLIAVLWIIYGYNMGVLSGDGFWGSVVANPFSDLGVQDLTGSAGLASVAFGSTFAIITTALISGAVADRARFGPWLLFAGIWATLSYFPVQGWVWAFNDDGLTGWIGKFGFGDTSTIDWAGGTAVHINAGAAALALALVLGKRVHGFSKEDATKPHNIPLVLIGCAILWFGWFGFNTGAATEDGLGSLIFLNTIGAPAAGALGFILIEWIRSKKATAVGAASGVVAGLVAITPSCANLDPFWAIVLGLVAGIVCAFAIELKYKLGYDDSLDVVGLHLVAGLIGCLYLGFFAQDTGLFFSGNLDQLLTQIVPALTVMVYSFVVAYVVGTVIDKTIGFRVKEEDEIAGIDAVVHGDIAYALD